MGSAQRNQARMGRPAGIEPATLGLGVPCSIQLSYGRANPRPSCYPAAPHNPSSANSRGWAEATAKNHRMPDPMTTPPRLLALATAVPPYALEQPDVMRRVEAVFGNRSSTVARLLPVFANTGIDRRYSCVPIDWYYEPHGWPDRNRTYLDSAVTLLESAATDALARARLTPPEIDAIVVVSTTGIATPSLDALLMERMNFKRTTRRLPIVGLGCAGGTLGLARAAELARADPGSRVLFLVIELCTLAFRRDDISKSNIVATALFSDGAAAAIISTIGYGPAITATGEHTFPDTLDIMGWDVADDGLRAIFSRDIPALIETELGAVADAFLAPMGLTRADINRVLAHPGGAKVLDALEDVFSFKPGALKDSRATLREYGNMSSATVIFVLARALERGALDPHRCGRSLVTSMGPGFSAAFALLESP